MLWKVSLSVYVGVCAAGPQKTKQTKKKHNKVCFLDSNKPKNQKHFTPFVSAPPALANICLPRLIPLYLFIHPALLCLPVKFTKPLRGFLCCLDHIVPPVKFWFFYVCRLSVAEATAGSTLDGGNIALAIFLLVLLLSVLLGGAYVYVTR